jgi:hypothetical protein
VRIRERKDSKKVKQRNTGAATSDFVDWSGTGVGSVEGAGLATGVDSTTGAATASEADIMGEKQKVSYGRE